jgi:PAS domain-containing protein
MVQVRIRPHRCCSRGCHQAVVQPGTRTRLSLRHGLSRDRSQCLVRRPGSVINIGFIGALASDYFLLPPRGTFVFACPAEQAGMMLFIAMGLGISPLAAGMHRAFAERESIVTLLREAEDKLRVANEQLESRLNLGASQLSVQAQMLDLATDAIMICDSEDRITWWDQGAASMATHCGNSSPNGRTMIRRTSGGAVYGECTEREGRHQGSSRAGEIAGSGAFRARPEGFVP